jgi:hypothetical protein
VDFLFKKVFMENNQYGQEGFNLPHDVVILPSGGKYYKTKKKSVKVGYLTAADENILVNATKNGGEGLIAQLVRNKMYEPDLKPEDLLEGDLETILMFLRNSSFGPEYTFNLIDPETGKSFEQTILLEELNFVKPEVEPDSDGNFTTILPKSGSQVKLKPLTYGDTIELGKLIDNYPKGLVPPTVTWRLQKQIVELNGSRELGTIAKSLEQMPIMDSKYIKNFIERNEPRIDLNREITAPSGRKVLTRITFGAEFFRPFF